MPLNTKLLQRKITLIAKDLKNLEKISKIPLAKYLNNDEFETLTERYLERIIGRMIDVNYHILAEAFNEIPEDYYSSFIKIGDKKILSSTLASDMASSAGLRNRLAHEYDEIDASKVYKAVPRCLKEVPRYLQAVQKMMEKYLKQGKML